MDKKQIHLLKVFLWIISDLGLVRAASVWKAREELSDQYEYISRID